MDTARGTARSGRSPGRRQEILSATRKLFDESGSRDAQIEDIARAVGINRAIIYRHFSSKEELFAEVVVTYLGELQAAFAAAADAAGTPTGRLEGLADAMIDFGLAHPAFVDCALALVRRPGRQLLDEVGEPALLRLGEAMWSCLQHAVSALEDGTQAGDFNVPDPVLLANLYYTQALGAMSLSALQWSVRSSGAGPEVDVIADDATLEEIKRFSRLSAVAQARGAV